MTLTMLDFHIPNAWDNYLGSCGGLWLCNDLECLEEGHTVDGQFPAWTCLDSRNYRDVVGSVT